MFKAKHNICCVYMLVFRKRNKCHFSLEHFNKSTIPSAFLVTAGKTKTWSLFLLTCLLLTFDTMTNYLYSFIQSKLGEGLPACRRWMEDIRTCPAQLGACQGLTTEGTQSCWPPPAPPLFSSVKDCYHPQLKRWLFNLLRMSGWKNA